MRKSAFMLAETAVVLFVLCVVALALMPVRHGNHRNVLRSQCQSNLKRIGLDFKMYTQDYDGRLPLLTGATAASVKAGEGAYGWADSLQPYLKSTEIYHCTTPKGQYEPWEKGYSDYFFNSQVAEKRSLLRVKFPISVVLVGEGNDGLDSNDARYALPSIPKSWLKDESSPLYRHLDGSNYLFVDGHVKWLRAGQAPGTALARRKTFTFIWRE